jgi:hypothetical protein
MTSEANQQNPGPDGLFRILTSVVVFISDSE